MTAGSMLWPRMGSVRLLLASVLVATLISAALVAALAGFAASALPQAVSSELARSPGTSIAVSGAFGAALARTDQRLVPAAVRRAFGPIPVSAESAIWSDPIGLPSARAVAVVRAAAMSQIRAHAVLVAGSWPAAAAAGTSVQAAAPASVARHWHWRIGQLLVLRDRQNSSTVRFRLTGWYRPLAPASPYWKIDLISPSGVTVRAGFVTYGPLVVDSGAFGSAIPVDGATWLETLATTRIPAGELRPLAIRLNQAVSYLIRSPDLGGLTVVTGLPGVLTGIAAKLVVARSLLAVAELELLVLVGAAVALSARTLATQRADEQALLGARGASRGQLVRLALAEGLLVTTVAAVAGVAAAGRLAHLSAAMVWAAAAVAAVCAALLGWPALRHVNPGTARVRRGRGAAVSAAVAAGADLGLIALAGLAVWQLRQYSVVSRSGTGLGLDPVLAAAPALALAAATVLPLRLLPLLARTADRAAARTRRLGPALASWELARRATRQSAPVLLVVLAVGTSTLALAQHQSWRRFASDQSAFAVGADVRTDTAAPATIATAAQIAGARGVIAAAPASSALVAPSGAVLALNARTAPAAVLLRPDEAAAHGAALWRLIRPAAVARAVSLPGRPVRLAITASLAAGAGAGLGPVTVSLAVADAAGIVYSVSAGVLPEDGRSHLLVARLTPDGKALYPLRLLGLTAGYTLPPLPKAKLATRAGSRVATFSVRGLAVSQLPAGPFGRRLAGAAVLAGWVPRVSSPDLAAGAGTGTPPRLAGRRGSPGIISFHPGDGSLLSFATFGVIGPVSGQVALVAPVPFRTIPAIATEALLRGGHLSVGDTLQVMAGQSAVTVKIVAAVASFPTITDPGGGLIVDQSAVQDVLAARSQPPLPVTQWWLATRDGAVPRGLPGGTTITSRSGLLARLLADPMSAIPQQAVEATALAAALLAIIGFSVAVAGSVRERRPQAALLAALGVDGAAQARLLCMEALALSVPAALTGLALGALLAHLLVPAVTISADASAPALPVLVEIPLAGAVSLALMVAAIPVLAAAALVAYRPDPAATLRAEAP